MAKRTRIRVSEIITRREVREHDPLQPTVQHKIGPDTDDNARRKSK